MRLLFWRTMWFVLEDVTRALLLLDALFYIYVYMSIWSYVSFKANVSLLIFCLDHLSISMVLKSPTNIVLLSISPFVSVNICFIHLGASMLGTNIYNLYILLWNWSIDYYVMSFFVFCNSLVLKSVLSDTSIATPALFWFPFAWNIFFCPLIFNLYL